MNDDFDVVEAEKEYKRLKETSDKANITFVICLFSVIILPVLLQFFIRKEIVIAIVVIGFILNYIIYIKKFDNSGKKLIDLNEKIIWNILADYFGKDNIEKTESFKIKNVQGDVIHRIGYKEFELYKNTYIYSKHYHESTLAKLYINLEGEATYRLKSLTRKKISKSELDLFEQIVKKYDIQYLELINKTLYLRFAKNIFCWNGSINQYKKDIESFKIDLDSVLKELKDYKTNNLDKK